MIVMGRVLGPFGVKGWIKVQTFTGEPDSLGRFGEWWLGEADGWKPVIVQDWEVHAGHMVAKLAEYADREEAAALRGREIAVPRDRLPPAAEGEFYQADLVGLQVINRSDERLGAIERIFSNGAHAIMAVRRGEEGAAGAERLIPFIPQVVDKVDVTAGEVRVDWGADW
jgi:16S rRNA processing protein RimM